MENVWAWGEISSSSGAPTLKLQSRENSRRAFEGKKLGMISHQNFWASIDHITNMELEFQIFTDPLDMFNTTFALSALNDNEYTQYCL